MNEKDNNNQNFYLEVRKLCKILYISEILIFLQFSVMRD